MRPFSDITANQIIPKALSPGFFFFFFFGRRRGGSDGGGGGCGRCVCVCVCVCVSVCVCVYGGGRWWSGCLCVFACIHGGGGGWFAKTRRREMYWSRSSASCTPAPYTLECTCILIMETNTPPASPPLPTPSLVVSSHFNLKGSSTSPSR